MTKTTRECEKCHKRITVIKGKEGYLLLDLNGMVHECPSCKDVSEPEHVEVLISENGKTLWINIAGHCVFRACRINNLVLHDERVEGTHDWIHGSISGHCPITGPPAVKCGPVPILGDDEMHQHR